MSCSCLFSENHAGWQNLLGPISSIDGGVGSSVNSGQPITEHKNTAEPLSTPIPKLSAVGRGPSKCLIRGGFLYTANPDQIYIENSWVLIVDKKIFAIGSNNQPEPEFDTLLDAKGKMVLPGLINPHWHESFVAPSDELPDDSKLTPTPYSQGGNIEALGSMFGFIAGVGKRLSCDEALAIARWSMWTQLRSGTTALGDVGSANTADAMGQAALDLGMRIRVSRWGSDIMIPNGASDFKRIADTQEQVDDWQALMETWDNHSSGLVGGMPSVMGAFGSSNEQLLAMGEIAQAFQSPYATHLAPLRNEAAAVKAVFGRTAIERFDHLGLLSDRLMAVHTAYATEEEYQRLLQAGVNICHSPAHYGMLGERTISETGQIARFIKDGACVSCSTDGDISYIGGMAEAMRATHLGHNEAANNNTACPPTITLLTATQNGAQALGWSNKIGSIEVGKQADLVLVDIDDWRYRVGNHPLRTFLVAGGSKDVDTVIVAGEVLVQNGQSTRFNESELFSDYESAVQSARSRIRP